MKKYLLATAAAAALFSSVPAFAGVNVYISPPPVPVPVPVVPVPPPPVPEAVVVLPPPPPGIVIAPGPPVYWFWSDERDMWFYYDSYRHPHYVRRHVFVDDGRHFFVEGGRWAPRHDMGRHRGWRKHERREERRERREERGHGRWERD